MVEPEAPVYQKPPANGKRKAESELERVDEYLALANSQQIGSDTAVDEHNEDEGQPVSKNQLKRLKRQEIYEEYKEKRKAKRKDKRHERQARKRAEREAKIAAAEAAGLDPKTALLPTSEPWRPHLVPVAFIIDCDFEEYMRDPEIVSLASQIVRSYSQNRRAKYQAHLLVSSWKGKLKTRFETVLKSSHEHWKGVHMVEGNFCEAAKKASELMAAGDERDAIDLLRPRGKEENDPDPSRGYEPDSSLPDVELESEDVDPSIVYLSSESPYTLERLEANTSYVIGGLVDRNREKGLCYKRARQTKVRTAKLPIGQFMAMQSRYVLTTNQVVEIMAKWLECGDWGEAFISVIPKRKGGTLKSHGSVADLDSANGDMEDGDGSSPPPLDEGLLVEPEASL
ncbi:guanine-1-methyltransferase-domain-containing protein [Lasiosphaeria miniovina]|uniref:tRNA (guanine(9)-N1)-methyltransferase n=1 Tax=Lasiosphaeria miniovina TaxID=1954250 RepID=A0AA40DTP8_9PEZI|nr:guanine-1-methyltransferase-domain-containing protein [Lasiosphaeria miniovina]KAK0712972.1 guanine-1-methyltransferase-domain-containing protein [Lasiosphaeria miniovina]